MLVAGRDEYFLLFWLMLRASTNRSEYKMCTSVVFQMMLVIGGQAPKAIRCVECYDFKQETWSQVADMPSRRCRCGM